ncbi:(2Fe-2S)-binding protein [Elusimicrobiota bacterium]
MKIQFFLNGSKTSIEVEPDRPLLRVLKEELNIHSVKEGCGRGECGTCTVLLDGKPVTSCMVPAGKIRGSDVWTLEGLDRSGKIQHIQRAFMEAGAVQCGFCTPGLLVTSFALLEKNSSPSRDDVRKAISGNLCRCTGYAKIIDAIMNSAGAVNRK